MPLGSPPLLVSDEEQAAFARTDALFTRLWVEVANNPTFKDDALCFKEQVKKTYLEEWKPYADQWKNDSLFDRAEIEKLNALNARANGWAKSCLPDYKCDKPGQECKVSKGVDPDAEHPYATFVDINAPGGGPPPPGKGIFGVKPATLVIGGLIGGVVLIGAAYALRTALAAAQAMSLLGAGPPRLAGPGLAGTAPRRRRGGPRRKKVTRA